MGLLDGLQGDAAGKLDEERKKLEETGKELRYTQQTVAGELAGWQDGHARMGRRAVRAFAEKMVVRERDRLERMRRAVRGVVQERR